MEEGKLKHAVGEGVKIQNAIASIDLDQKLQKFVAARMEVLCRSLVDAVKNDNDFRLIRDLEYFDKAQIGEKVVELLEEQKLKKLSPDLLHCMLKHMDAKVTDQNVI